MLETQIKEVERDLVSIDGLIFALWGLFVESKHREALGVCMHKKADFYYLFCTASKTNLFICRSMKLPNERFQN